MSREDCCWRFFYYFDSTLVSIVSVDAYDTNDLPGPWSSNLTYKFADPRFLHLLLYFGGAVPDTDGDIILAKVRFRA